MSNPEPFTHNHPRAICNRVTRELGAAKNPLIKHVWQESIENAEHTVSVEKAAPFSEFHAIIVGSARSLLASFLPLYEKQHGKRTVSDAVRWFARRGVVA